MSHEWFIRLFHGLVRCRRPVQTASDRRTRFPIQQRIHSLWQPAFFPCPGPFPHLFPVPAPASVVSASTSLSSVRFALCPPIVWSGPPILSPSDPTPSTRHAFSTRASSFRSKPPA